VVTRLFANTSYLENLCGYRPLGGLCRFHHQLKQRRGWQLTQTSGVFTWTTPTGRSYTTEPDSHAA
jgi:hypothetical protein